jgi:bleomycin hydrolase
MRIIAFSTIILLVLSFVFSPAFSQVDTTKNKARFIEYKQGFYENEILRDGRQAEVLLAPAKKKYFKADTENKDYPVNLSAYTQFWHNSPVCQGNSGTCWCFATTSFMESEAKRLHNKEIKLSEMYTVYWEYVERAADFVRTRGETYYAEGSEATAIPKIWKKYGIVPLQVYEGKPTDRKFHSHRQMVEDMLTYLEDVKKNNRWDEKKVIKDIRAILDKTMSAPPESFTWEGKTYTPQSFLKEYLQLNMDDYYSFMSTASAPWNQKSELVEADNWWHCDDYYNVTANDFMKVINDALDVGYTISLCGDISEPGYDNDKQIAIIPTFDITTGSIDDNARQFRLENGSTTDDHCIHLIGYFMNGNERWYLIKDSNGGAFDGPSKGYRFFREDYIKLKMMNVLLHKEAARPTLDKIIK